ncbi:baseplate assembly protein [Gluconobacter potus]|uniref:Baseplate assembly protein n=1 Tax=Gluconobacter potus TaxID=2724927 RepID=A0A149QPI0_9PROT|nr:phage baseplate assembly protein V [Gluconobacter potus]KXU99224.1 baseplate assembly protein [Gluconobacter potus]
MTDGATRGVIAGSLNRIPQPVLGLVSAVDPVTHSCKVLIQPDETETGWLPFMSLAVGDLRISAPPHIGQQVQVLPQEGDAEHNVVTGSLFDDIVGAPVSPATGEVAQPGEMLIQTGCGAPPQDTTGRTAGAATSGAPYWHITPTALYFGAGTVSGSVQNGSFVVKVGSCVMTLSASGLAITGGPITTDGNVVAQGDVKTSEHSLSSHVHTNGNDGADTGGPVG